MTSLVQTTQAPVGIQTTAPVPILAPEVGTNPSSVTIDWLGADAGLRAQRQQTRGRTAQLARGHRELYTALFSDRVRDAIKRTARAILDDLATEFGLAWVDLARMVGVSVPAIRKWRLDGGLSPDNHRRLAEVLAFLSVLREHGGVEDPVGWLAQHIVPGFSLTVRHLYAPDHVGLLLDFAAGGIRPEEMLEALEPDWQETYRSDYEVAIFADGEPGIVRRA